MVEQLAFNQLVVGSNPTGGIYMSRKHDAGKGDTFRPVDREKYSRNWDKIFKKGIENVGNKTVGSSKRRTNNRKK